MRTPKHMLLSVRTVTMLNLCPSSNSLTSDSSERRFFACAALLSSAAAEGAGRLSIIPGKLRREEVAADKAFYLGIDSILSKPGVDKVREMVVRASFQSVL